MVIASIHLPLARSRSCGSAAGDAGKCSPLNVQDKQNPGSGSTQPCLCNTTSQVVIIEMITEKRIFITVKCTTYDGVSSQTSGPYPRRVCAAPLPDVHLGAQTPAHLHILLYFTACQHLALIQAITYHMVISHDRLRTYLCTGEETRCQEVPSQGHSARKGRAQLEPRPHG